MPKAKGYVIAPQRGVFQVYQDEAAREANNPLPYAYPRLDMFVQDMTRLCTMIADGPLWV